MTTHAHHPGPAAERSSQLPHQPHGRRMGPRSAPPNIADRYADLIAQLSPRRRRGMIARLSQGYFEGWRPSRDEVADLVAQELRKSPR
jgi:hypothetical protein